MLSRFNALPYLKVCEPTPRNRVTNQQLIAVGIMSLQTDSLAGLYKLQRADPKPTTFCCKFLSFEVSTYYSTKSAWYDGISTAINCSFFLGVVSCTDFLLRNMMDFLSIGYVNIEFIFPFFGNPQWYLYSTQSISNWLFITQSSVLQADSFIFDDNVKSTLQMNMHHSTQRPIITY